MTTLIVGATGCLGYEVAEYYNDIGRPYVTLGRNVKNSHGSEHINCDLSDLQNVNKIQLEGFTQVLYLAQSREYKNYPKGFNDVFAINHRAALCIAEKCMKLEIPFIYTSSGAIYEPDETVLKEDSRVLKDGTLNAYSASKIATEEYLFSLPNSRVIRPFFIYGKKSSPNSLFHGLFNKIINGQTISITGATGMRFNPIYSKDAARAIATLPDNAPRVLNLAGEEITTLIEVIHRIGAVLNRTPNTVFLPGDVKNSVGDISALIESGFTYEWPLNKSLAEMADQFKN